MQRRQARGPDIEQMTDQEWIGTDDDEWVLVPKVRLARLQAELAARDEVIEQARNYATQGSLLHAALKRLDAQAAGAGEHS